MTVNNTKKSETQVIALVSIYFIIFAALWSVRELVLRGILVAAVGEFGHELIGEALKLVIWTCPAVYLILKYKNDMLVELKTILSFKVNIIKYLPVFLVFAAYNIIGAYILNGKIGISSDFNAVTLISSVLFVGVTEEAVFRGFLLNITYKKMKPWLAVSINALMFLVIHFPIWIHNGIFLSTIMSGSFLLIIALSVTFSLVFIKSKNILIPIALHMFWNLLVTLLFS